jgi:hypothetical protein
MMSPATGTGSPTGVNGASDRCFAFDMLEVKPVVEEIEDIAIFPGVDIGGSATSKRLTERNITHVFLSHVHSSAGPCKQ